MKYKVGDKVKVRSDLEVDVKYDGVRFDGNMKKFKTVTLKEIVFDNWDVEENYYHYSEEMFEGLVEPKIEGYTLDELKDIIKAYEKGQEHVKPKTVWDLKDGDGYWAISINSIYKLTWRNDKTDNEIRNQGDCFLTKEEAEFKLEARKVYTQLKKYSREFVEGNFNWSVGCYPSKNEIDMSHSSRFKWNELYFESEEILQKAIDEVGEDRVLKYYLKVK